MATTLKEILGAMLSDAIRAQHDTNSYLQSIAEQYSANGRLAGLKLPSASIGELQLSLNFAVTGGIEQLEEESVNGKGVEKAMRYICNEVAELLVKTLVHCIQQSGADYKTYYAFVDTLPGNKDFVQHLRRRFYALLLEEKETLVDDNARLRQEPVSRILYHAAAEQLLEHEDIRGFFAQDDARGLQERILEEFDRVLEKELDDIMRESMLPSFRQIQRFGSLNVEIGDEALAQLPPSAIQTMTITINPTGEVETKKS